MSKLTLLSFFLLFMFSLFSCHIGKQGVDFSEFQSPPLVRVAENNLTIKVTNSTQNTAKAIYKIEVAVRGTSVYISAYQKLVGIPFAKYTTECQNSLDKLGISSAMINNYQFFGKTQMVLLHLYHFKGNAFFNN